MSKFGGGGVNYTVQKYVAGNIYRLQLYNIDNLTSFTNEYIDILDTLRNQTIFFLFRDFNIALLKLSSNDNYSMFFDNVTLSCFVPKITLPIRICDTPSTLIDNVYTNAIDKIYTSCILIRPISDYQMHFCILNENYAKTNNARRYIEVKVSSEHSIDQFRNEFANSNIYNKLDHSPNANPNINYELLAEQLRIAKSTHVPQTIKRFNKRRHK